MSAAFRTLYAARSVVNTPAARQSGLAAQALRLSPVASSSSTVSAVRFSSSWSKPTSFVDQGFTTRDSAAAPAPGPTSTSRFRGLPKFEFGQNVIPEKDTEPDAWWRDDGSLNKNDAWPGNQFTGRSEAVMHKTYAIAQRTVNGIMGSTGAKRDIRAGEYHIKPNVLRWRTKGLRFRRRFQEEVSPFYKSQRTGPWLTVSDPPACAARPDAPRPQVEMAALV